MIQSGISTYIWHVLGLMLFPTHGTRTLLDANLRPNFKHALVFWVHQKIIGMDNIDHDGQYILVETGDMAYSRRPILLQRAKGKNIWGC